MPPAYTAVRCGEQLMAGVDWDAAAREAAEAAQLQAPNDGKLKLLKLACDILGRSFCMHPRLGGMPLKVVQAAVDADTEGTWMAQPGRGHAEWHLTVRHPAAA